MTEIEALLTVLAFDARTAPEGDYQWTFEDPAALDSPVPVGRIYERMNRIGTP